MFKIDGKSVPWEMTPVNAGAPGELDGLLKKLNEAKLTISLGVRDRYLLLGIGESTAHIEKLGQGKSLAERPEMKPLAVQGDKRFVRIGYESQAFRNETSFVSPTKKDLAETAKRFKDEVVRLIPNQDSKLVGRVTKDIDDFFREQIAATSDPGAMISFTFLTDRGWETYDYDWTENLTADGSKPLTLLDHIGGDPLMASVSRSRYKPESYSRLVKWVKVLHGYFEEMALPKLDPQTQQGYGVIFGLLKPQLERMDKATSEKLLPAMQDGQSAWVFDGKPRTSVRSLVCRCPTTRCRCRSRP